MIDQCACCAVLEDRPSLPNSDHSLSERDYDATRPSQSRSSSQERREQQQDRLNYDSASNSLLQIDDDDPDQRRREENDQVCSV